MVRDKKFLESLEKKLQGLNEKDRDFIMSKYKRIIKGELAKKRKITAILKDLGTPDEVAVREVQLLKKRKDDKNIFKRFYKTITKDLTVKDKEELEKKKKEKEDKKRKKQELKEKRLKEKEIQKQNKIKNKNKEVKKVTKVKKVGKLDKKEDKKDKKISDIKILGKFKSFKESLKITDVKKVGKLNKKEEPKNEIQKTVLDIKKDTEDIIGDISNEISEKHIFESKEKRRKRILYTWLKVIFVIVMLFIFLWITVLSLACIFAFLDGVKFLGLVIGAVSLDLLWLWIMVMITRVLFHKKNNFKLNMIIVILLVIGLALGITLFVRKLYSIESKTDVSEKYSMTNKHDTYILPSDPNKKLTFIFNANYDTQYVIDYDENMLGKVKVSVNYYEAYYDYFIKKSSDQVYISLKIDSRDRLSTYISDIKDGVIYDDDEMSRYLVKISMSKEDAGRVEFVDSFDAH